MDEFEKFLKAVDNKLDLMAQAWGIHPGWVATIVVAAALVVWLIKVIVSRRSVT